jgi:hypothetical protein
MVSVPAMRGIRTEGVDVVHVLEVGLGGALDSEVFDYARTQGRIVVTRNYQDFAPLVTAYASAGRSFPGVLFLRASLPPGDPGAHVRAFRSWMERNQDFNPVKDRYGWL